MDNVDLGLLLFDPANRERPLAGVEYQIKHLAAATMRQYKIGLAQPSDPLEVTAPMLLVAARPDRGTPTLTDAEIDAFCQNHGTAGYIRTSALENAGIDDLMARIKAALPWNRLTPTVTTDTFRGIKGHVLRLKETGGTKSEVLVPADALRQQLQATQRTWHFEDAEMLTAVRHLANHGYVVLIRPADGDHSVLLASDLLVNLASTFVCATGTRRYQNKYDAAEEDPVVRAELRLINARHMKRDSPSSHCCERGARSSHSRRC